MRLSRHWIDEYDVIHVLNRDVLLARGRITLVCTRKPVPSWGLLEVNHTYNPATCLVCIAEEHEEENS